MPSPIIAVNLSLRLAAHGIPIDYWAMVDHPQLLWDWSEPYRMLRPRLRYMMGCNANPPVRG